MIDYPMRLGMARAGLLDIHRDLGRVLNRCKLDDETNDLLQAIHQHISDVLARTRTEGAS